jgi:hypothetical protein
MVWYEIVGVVVIWIVGLYLRGKIYEDFRNRHFNDSWRDWK